MASKYHGNKLDRLVLKEKIQWLVPRVYASIACELWDMGWDSDQIQELFANSQERWRDSTENGWDMLKNVQEVTGIEVQYFRNTGNIV